MSEFDQPGVTANEHLVDWVGIAQHFSAETPNHGVVDAEPELTKGSEAFIAVAAEKMRDSGVDGDLQARAALRGAMAVLRYLNEELASIGQAV